MVCIQDWAILKSKSGAIYESMAQATTQIAITLDAALAKALAFNIFSPPFPLLDRYPQGVYIISIVNKDKNVNTSTPLSIDPEQIRRVKDDVRKRINIIKGQLDGLLKMIEEDEYCIDLLNQSLAIQNSIKSLDALLFERHLKTHVVDQFHNETNKAIEELLRLFKRIHQ